LVITTITWLLTTFLTQPESAATLRGFYRLTRPGGPGWKKVVEEARAAGDPIDEVDRNTPWEMPAQILMVFIGCISIYSSLFSIGNFVYGRPLPGTVLALVALGGTYALFRLFGKLRAN
jgi:solute:Na+ symporter, SSS family